MSILFCFLMILPQPRVTRNYPLFPYTTSFRSEEDPEQEFEAIVIHFLPDCLGKDLLLLPEAQLIGSLYEKARKGMLFDGESKLRLANLMHSALKAEGLERLIVL